MTGSRSAAAAPTPGYRGYRAGNRRQGENVDTAGWHCSGRAKGCTAYSARAVHEMHWARPLNGEGLIVEQAPQTGSRSAAAIRAASFTPGGHKVVGVTDGVADQTPGWKGREYMIDRAAAGLARASPSVTA